MRKRTIGLICLLHIAVAASVLLYFFGILPFYRAVSLTISDLCSDPESWTGKRVRVRGTLMGPLVFIPEGAPPYNYLLEDTDTRKSIGILWEGSSIDLHGKNVTVTGVVRRGYTHPPFVKALYYIEAETINPL